MSVRTGGEQVAAATFERTFGPAVGIPTPAASGVRGTYFAPPDGAAAPGVVVLGGSDGGEFPHTAALLAAHGYAALSLAYFGVEDRPTHLERIELGYFDKALDWLVAQPGADGRLAVLGLSRGGELALQLGALFPRIGAVVAAAPSSVRQAGLTSNWIDFTQPAWVHDGTPLPFVPGRFGPPQFLAALVNWALRRPLRQRRMFERLYRDIALTGPATIEVERIAGPVLLLSGTSDELWPSGRYAEDVLARLRAHGHQHADRHASHPGAGHFVSAPYGMPSLPPMTRLSPGPGFTIDFGGSPEHNAASASRSWQ